MRGKGVVVQPIAAGVRTDMADLCELFIKKGDISFKGFKEVWIKAGSVWMFAFHNTEAEAREFVEKALVYALLYVVPNEALPLHMHDRGPLDQVQKRMQMFGIYLLYSMYETQKAVLASQGMKPVKIRIMPFELGQLVDLVQALWNADQIHMRRAEGSADCVDAFTCLHLLWSRAAFHICVYKDEHNPVNLFEHEQRDWEVVDSADSAKDLIDVHKLMLLAQPVDDAMEQLEKSFAGLATDDQTQLHGGKYNRFVKIIDKLLSPSQPFSMPVAAGNELKPKFVKSEHAQKAGSLGVLSEFDLRSRRQQIRLVAAEKEDCDWHRHKNRTTKHKAVPKVEKEVTKREPVASKEQTYLEKAREHHSQRTQRQNKVKKKIDSESAAAVTFPKHKGKVNQAADWKMN